MSNKILRRYYTINKKKKKRDFNDLNLQIKVDKNCFGTHKIYFLCIIFGEYFDVNYVQSGVPT